MPSSGSRVTPALAMFALAAAFVVAAGIWELHLLVTRLFPRITLPVAELLVLAIALPAAVIGQQLRQGRRFSLIVVYSLIFLSEFVVGTFVATGRDQILWRQQLSSDSVIRTLGLAVLGYAVLVAGYLLPSLARRGLPPGTAPARAARGDAGADFPPAYRVILFLMMALTTVFGFVQLALRIKKAGSFAAYLAIAYTMRIGTYAETDAANAWAVLASLLASGALPAAALLYIAWMRGKLSTFEKALLMALTVALIGRQLSTAFRAVVVFTLFSAFAVYDAERRIRARRLAVMGVVIVAALVGVNYVHVLLHSLTGVGGGGSFAESSMELLAPHAYLETFARMLEVRDRMVPLEGKGVLTSMLFFVPRAIWLTKLPTEEFGTGLVQAWAGFPTTYQIAISNIGELFVHFGYFGLIGMFLWGMAYRWFDGRWSRSLEWRVTLLCISAPRVFADQGMGISAFAITVLSVAMFIVPLDVASRLAGLGPLRTRVSDA